MSLVPAKCSMCGSSIKVDDSSEKGICEHCGTEYITEKVINNHTTNYNVTNNITKVVNGKETDLEEEMFARALNHKKLGNIEEAKEILRNLTQKYPDVAQYHLHYALIMSYDFEGLFRLRKDSAAYEELDNFFKTAKKEEIATFCKEYGIEETEDTTKIKESFLTYSQNAYVANILIPAFKNNSFVNDILDGEQKNIYNFKLVLEKLTEENIKKLKKPANAYLKQIKDKIEEIEDLVEAKENLSVEEEKEYKKNQHMVNILEDYFEEFNLWSDTATNKKAELKKLEKELAESKAKKKAKKDKVNNFMSKIYISLSILGFVFVVFHFIFFAQLPRTAENKMGLAAQKSIIVALICAVISFVIMCVWKYVDDFFFNLGRNIKYKKHKKTQELLKTNPSKASLKAQARTRLVKKIGEDSLYEMSKSKENELIALEMEKIKKERKAKNNKK